MHCFFSVLQNKSGKPETTRYIFFCSLRGPIYISKNSKGISSLTFLSQSRESILYPLLLLFHYISPINQDCTECAQQEWSSLRSCYKVKKLPHPAISLLCLRVRWLTTHCSQDGEILKTNTSDLEELELTLHSLFSHLAISSRTQKTWKLVLRWLLPF